jgi:WD40 repeat protein
VTPAAVRVNPYPGLTPFDEPDAARFFGRDREIEEIVQRLASRRLLAVIGVSGCGKSSLVHAGLKPILRLGAAPNLPARWRICTITPGNAPLLALQATVEAPSDWPNTSFDLLDRARQMLGPGESLLLIVDQFEEIFRFRAGNMGKDGGNAASLFVNLLLKAIDQREVPIYVLLTMRTDFLGECAQFRGLPEALNDCYYMVPRMGRLQQQDAIERPLQEQGVEMHAPLVQRLLNDSADDPDQLPVLQHLLRRVWENWSHRGGSGHIGLDDYEAVGGWNGAIDNDGERVMARFPAEKQSIRRLFQWITERGTGERPIRRPRPLAECRYVSGLDRERLLEILQAFEERGLLRRTGSSDHSLVDLPHESVMWQWPRLHGWIREEAERASQLRFLLQSARNQLPLTGLALSTGLEFRAHWRKQGEELPRHLEASEAEEVERWVELSARIQRSKRLRRRWIVGGIVGAIVALALVAVVISETQRSAAQARELSAWSAISLSDDPERGLILGLHAWAKQGAMVAGLEQSLHDAVLQSQVRLTFRGHKDRVQSVAWSPDGSRLATASVDKTAIVWDAETGRELLTFRGHGGYVFGIVWSPDGSKLASASQDGTAKVWEAQTGRELLTLRGHRSAVNSVAWSADGRKLATAGNDQTAKVWDARTGAELLTLRGHLGDVYGISWSPDGSKLATAGDDRTARVWQADTGRELLRLLGHKDHVRSIAWSPDGRKLASGSEDEQAKVWQATTGRELLTLSGHRDDVLSVAWSPDGGRLATTSADNTIRVWDSDSGRELGALRGHKDDVQSCAWSPDGRKLATGSVDNTAKVWETGGGRELVSLRGHQAPLNGVAWSADGSRLATASGDQTAKVWDAATGRVLLTLRANQGPVNGVAWRPDGSKLATSSNDRTARVWDAATGRELLTLRGHQGPVNSVAWRPDGSKLATSSNDRTARVWDAATGRELLTLRSHQGPINSVAWKTDGSKLATASDDQTAKVWDATSAELLLTLHGHQRSVTAVAWSADGGKLATASNDQTAKIWDAATGRELLTLRGHQNYVVAIAWSPDANRLATASRDNTAKIWDTGTGRELLSLSGHQNVVFSVAWSPDGKRLATAGADDIGQIYAIDPTLLLRMVRSRITRDLMPDECRHYLNARNCPMLPVVP